MGSQVSLFSLSHPPPFLSTNKHGVPYCAKNCAGCAGNVKINKAIPDLQEVTVWQGRQTCKQVTTQMGGEYDVNTRVRKSSKKR